MQNIPPPPYSPLPSIDSFETSGPVVGPDGRARPESSSDVLSFDNASSSTSVDEREEAGPGSQLPAYTEKYGELDISQDGMETRAQIACLSCNTQGSYFLLMLLIQWMAEST